MKAIILGSTGLIGSTLISKLDADASFTEVIALVRKKTDKNFSKAKEVVFDFENPTDSVFEGIDIIFCCLGTTIKKAGSKEAFRKVDFEYPLVTAQLAKNKGVGKYAIVTAMGADKSSAIFYNKVKGEIESELEKLNFPSLGIFRPSMLLGERKEFRLGEKIGQMAMKALAFLIPANYKAIQGSKVAEAMVKFSKQTQNSEKEIIFSGEML
ncbi:NAD-dependent epimerase/dehydratase family protein [Lacihabitans sp. LS3-19]|uniref:NAD(P)H-binding protein n=1 Tax=Lacihabitans sp. LS3-19 TaxID=2487335 RepID=UPI0020CD0107|nr:NAD(P)H-binding protein [Lacihabitans sp. LS3-19]MCP9769009.1 NAD-dependent epimerase/dehydratase family protein [Lacihabitans sp. LS3-19]